MEHSIERKVVLTDLLDRVLDRGIAIHADVIISLAGIPLVGINLRALIAGMETMTDYGVMHEWDGEIRGERMMKIPLDPPFPKGEIMGSPL